MTAASPQVRGSGLNLFHRLCGSSSTLHEDTKKQMRCSNTSSESSAGSKGVGKPNADPLATAGHGRLHHSDSSGSLTSQCSHGTPKVRQLPGSELLSEFVSELTLGLGSSGKVWLCRSCSTGAKYALKEIRKSGNASFKKGKSLRKGLVDISAPPDPVEGERMASSLPPHPNVLRVHEVILATDGHNAKVVMEAALGGDLSSLDLHTGGVLNEHRLAEIMWQVLQGVNFLHGLGIVHGDIKPGNMLLGGAGDSLVKLADLGCATRFPEGQCPSTWWITNRPGGTPAYLSPEQTTEEPYLGTPAEVWALGVSMFQLATKKMPFKRDSIIGLYMAIASDPLPPLEEITLAPSPELYGLLQQMLHKDPDRRISLREVANHPWFQKRGRSPTAGDRR